MRNYASGNLEIPDSMLTHRPGTTLSPPRLHPRPQPVDDALRRRIARGDVEQFRKRRLVRIDVLVAQNLRIYQLLARQIAIGIGQKIRIPGGDLGPVELVDQLIGFPKMLRIAGIARLSKNSCAPSFG